MSPTYLFVMEFAFSNLIYFETVYIFVCNGEIDAKSNQMGNTAGLYKFENAINKIQTLKLIIFCAIQ